MKFFRYQADRIPVLCITLLFLADLIVYLTVDNVYFVLLWVFLGIAPKVCVCSWNHHHQHCATFRQTILNRCLELVYALHTGITTNAWVLHHNLGHHINYLDQKKDESRWMRPDGTTMKCAEYTVKLALTGYLDAYRVGRRHPKFQRSFLSMSTIVLFVVVALVYFRPQNGILIFLLPMFMGYIFTCWHTYYHHAGLDTDDHLEASYNIMHRWYNLFTGNLGYHTAHHMKQALHWSKLPDFHASIEAKIPKHLYREPCIPFKWFRG